MEQAKQSSTQQLNEVENLKTKFGENCKVIKNIGIFSHVVTIKYQGDFEASVKFQLEASYPETIPAIYISSKQLAEDENQVISEKLQTQAKELIGESMLEALFNTAVQLLVEYFESNKATIACDKPLNEKAVGKSSKKKIVKKTKGVQETKQYNKKLPSMKTANDVVKRISWDDQLDVEHFSVGYIDRFVGVVERSFSTFSWEDIASVDYEVLAIPKHRIQYFKYKDLTVWDKDSRMDNVFGSTGSGFTITDMIDKYESGEITGDKPGAGSLGLCKTAKHSDNMDSDEDEDDIIIKTGLEEENKAVFPRETYWGPKKKPTHFICLRITDEHIQKIVSEAHDIILSMEPSYSEHLIPLERLHITLLCLGLDTKEEVNKAVQTLNKIKSELEVEKPKTIKIQLHGAAHFFQKVLYAKVEENPNFLSFARKLTLLMQENGHELRDVFDFHPHMTLFKFKKQLQRDMHTKFIEPSICEALSQMNFGSQMLENIHLCEMSENRDERGFYITPTALTFDH